MSRSNLDYCISLVVALGKGIYSVKEDIYLSVERTGQFLGLS